MRRQAEGNFVRTALKVLRELRATYEGEIRKRVTTVLLAVRFVSHRVPPFVPIKLSNPLARGGRVS